MDINRGMILDINLNPVRGSETGKTRPCVVVTNDIINKKVPVIQVIPITDWNEKKEKIITNIILEPTTENGLAKKSIADCLQTRPIDYKIRTATYRGQLSADKISEIDKALKIIFDLS